MAREPVFEEMTAYRQECEERFASDPHRPHYHFLPPENWMNDPNGPIWFDGRYHLFYQHNPEAPKWGNIAWGHATSVDLVHWEDWPIALRPDTEDVDAAGCFTGCAFLQSVLSGCDDTPTIAYTGVPALEVDPPGVRRDNQSLAISHDGMVTWEKIEQNPVIAAPPEGLDVVGFRDPCVWRERDTWKMLVGSGLRDRGGTVLLYESSDLVNWRYCGTPLVGETEEHGTMWECPDLFPLGERHLLLVSTLGRVLYFAGGWDGRRFTSGRQGWADVSPTFYAAKSFRGPHGRRILWGWLREARQQQQQIDAGWAGVMSLPRVLTVGRDGEVRCDPAEEVETIRGRLLVDEMMSLRPGHEVRLDGVQEDCFELAVDAGAPAGARLEIGLRCSPGGEELTRIIVDTGAGTVAIDTSTASLDPGAEGRVTEGKLKLMPDERLRLRIFVDRSVVEVFANSRCCVSERIYPSRPDSLGVRIGAETAASEAHVRLWRIRDIWTSL